MKMFLDIERFNCFVNRHFGSEAMRLARLVGANRLHDSWYFDIVRFFGSSRTDPVMVPILREPGSFRRHDPVIARFSDKVENMLRSEGRIYDGPKVVRVTQVDWTHDSASMSVQPIRYGDQVACFAMDLPDPIFDNHGGTLREYLLAKYPSVNLENWPLGTGLGVCGHLLIAEDDQRFLLRARRSARVASLENSIGASVAGSVEFEMNCRNLAEMIVESLSREVEEELGLEQSEFSVTPLAYAREMVRGNRPQLFAGINTTLDRKQVAERISSLPESRKELSEFQFIPLQNLRLSESEISPFDFEGKMCWYLLEEWVSESKPLS